MEYDFQRCTRHCAVTGKELAEGETFYSVLTLKGAEVERLDYSEGAWQGPPENALGWWKSKIPSRESKKPRLAPHEVLLSFFSELEDQPQRQDIRYVLALLLLRRRILKLEETEVDEEGIERLVVVNPRDDAVYQVKSTPLSDERMQEIEKELTRLLFTESE